MKEIFRKLAGLGYRRNSRDYKEYSMAKKQMETIYGSSDQLTRALTEYFGV